MKSNMKVQQYAMVILMLLGLVGAGRVFAENPHEISASSQAVDCVACHVEKPQGMKTDLLNSKNHQADMAAFKSDGVEMCAGCHNKDDGHKVGLKMDFEVPADLPLGSKNKLTCLTCHYTHGSLSSKRPQASVSFMDSMLDSERLHKSYLLRRNNAEGELCLTCHEVKEGSK
jgi:formate-dependent nitrite reductase cytochrome c552 subunit